MSFTCLSPPFRNVHIYKEYRCFCQVVKSETSIIETLNYFSGIIISVKTRSERQLLRLKQVNIQLATKIQHLEFSCSEKVRKCFWASAICLQSPAFSLGPVTQAFAVWGPSPGVPLPLAKSSCAFRVSLGIASFPDLCPVPLLLSLLLSAGPHLTGADSLL